ncbi:hypothetical protein PsYK624_006470 [Phanerochaete sordida]|uniref:Uncharacterized protein n=1 Tax=Phanerochaete sordida TaxID=48140 RepID=A0A9P3FXW7_9APHY|nr:hypothetical protein PsYK624_006470 [Phanerochaete sordida]
MAVDIPVDDLHELPRVELQKLAKKYGIKANLKTAIIIEKLGQEAAKTKITDQVHPGPSKLNGVLANGLAPTASSAPVAATTASTFDQQTLASQFLRGVHEEISKKLSCPSPEQGSPSIYLPPRSPPPPPYWAESASYRPERIPVPAPVQADDDSLDLEDYEVVMDESELPKPTLPTISTSSHTPLSEAGRSPLLSQAPPRPWQHLQPNPLPVAPPLADVFRRQPANIFAAAPPPPNTLPPPHGPAAPGPAPLYTPNGKHVYTDDPHAPVRPRVFYPADDPNRPSARHTQRPPTRRTARRHLRECHGYLAEPHALSARVHDAERVLDAARQRLGAAERRLARMQAARAALERHWAHMLKADARLHDGSWTWTRPAARGEEVPRVPRSPPAWRTDGGELGGDGEEFRVADPHGDGRPVALPKHPEHEREDLDAEVGRFEGWLAKAF